MVSGRDQTPANSGRPTGSLRSSLNDRRNLPYVIFGGLLLLSLLCRLFLLMR